MHKGRMEGETGNERWETNRERREHGRGKGGRGGEEKGRGVPPASAPIHQYLQNNFTLKTRRS